MPSYLSQEHIIITFTFYQHSINISGACYCHHNTAILTTPLLPPTGAHYCHFHNITFAVHQHCLLPPTGALYCHHITAILIMPHYYHFHQHRLALLPFTGALSISTHSIFQEHHHILAEMLKISKSGCADLRIYYNSTLSL